MSIDVQRQSQVTGRRTALACPKCDGQWFRPGTYRGESRLALYCWRCGMEVNRDNIAKRELPGPSAA